MDILTGIFGDPVPTAVKLILLTLVLVGLLLLVFWVFRKFVGSPAIKTARGRQPRLAVTDAANLDDKRRLVLVRRDDVEHLVMIGGATDVLIESNIVRAVLSRKNITETSTPVEPEPVDEIETTNSDNLNQVIAAAGVVSTTAIVTSTTEEAMTSENLAVAETPTDKHITTVEEIKDAAMADVNFEEPAMETPSEVVSDVSIPDLEIDLADIEPDALSNLEDALGEELTDIADPVEPEVKPETPVESQSTAEPVSKTPEMEDEMQKLLDELSGEKT